MHKGIIFHTGEYPIGSSALRVRMWHKGIEVNEVSNSVIISFPKPTLEELKNTEDFVWFALKPLSRNTNPFKRIKRSFFSIILRLIGTRRALCKIKKEYTDINFIFLISTGLIEGYWVSKYCRKRKIKLFIEKADENRRRFKEHKGLLDYLAILQEDIFDRYIIPKSNALFVVSSFLENKFKRRIPSLKLVRSLPSFIDYDYFISLQKNQISDITDFPNEILSNGNLNIVFAGSCIFTNGLFFFLECAADLYKKGFKFNILFVIFKGDIVILNRKVKTLQLENFYIVENVFYEYIPTIYQIADILVLPEMGEEVAAAGFPGKSAEYLASGKVIITTNFSNLTDYFVHEYNCLMSPLKDKKQYSENLAKLLLDNSLRLKLGENAIKTAVTKFDYKKGVLPLIHEL